MAERFVYRGMPVRDTSGNVIAVQPMRGIVADNGLTYPGVLERGADEQAFTYRQVPNDYLDVPRLYVDGLGRVYVTDDGKAILVR